MCRDGKSFLNCFLWRFCGFVSQIDKSAFLPSITIISLAIVYLAAVRPSRYCHLHKQSAGYNVGR